MTLCSLCVAVYKCNSGITSWTKFVEALFQACGPFSNISNYFGLKLLKRELLLDPVIRSTSAQLISLQTFRNFLQKYIILAIGKRNAFRDRIRGIGGNARFGRIEEIDQFGFFWALIDRLNSIIRIPEDTELLLDYYLQRVNGGVPEKRGSYLRLTYTGEKVSVLCPSRQRVYPAVIWGEFGFHRIIRHTGQDTWRGCQLTGLNPKGTGVATNEGFNPVTDGSSSQTNLVEIVKTISARGRKGKATSKWEVYDESTVRCFPGSPTDVIVEAIVINSHFPCLGGN